MKVDVAAEVAACLKSPPGGNPTTEHVKGWLFDSRNGVAVRLSRILEDKLACDLLTKAAGRSWRQCRASDSEPQKLWQELGASFGRIAAEDDRASVRVGPFPKDRALGVNLLPTALLDGSRTVRTLADECRGFCAAPLLTPSDLICPFPEVSLPYYGPARQWQDNPPQAVRLFCNVQQVAVGDFIPASVVLRLRLLIELRFVLRSEWTECAKIDKEYKGFADRANAIHGQLWATPDAEARNGAMGLLQVHLAGGKPPGIVGLMGYEPDWSILPADVPKLLDIDRDGPMDPFRRIEALGLPPTFGERHGRLEYIVSEAVKTRPGEVANIVKAGLEWLASRLPAMGDDFADVEGLPAEIASILKQGDFPALSDDEYSKLGAWLTANASKAAHDLTPANLAKTRRMEKAKNALWRTYVYNAAVRQSVAASKVGKKKRRRRPALENKAPRAMTRRQVEVVQIVGECKGNFAEAGRRLGVDRKTIKETYDAAMGKLRKAGLRQPERKIKTKTTRLPEDNRGQVNVADDLRRAPDS